MDSSRSFHCLTFNEFHYRLHDIISDEHHNQSFTYHHFSILMNERWICYNTCEPISSIQLYRLINRS